jgi:hypothetical protein
MSDQTERRWDEARRTWEEVGRQFAEVGRHVEQRYRSMEGESSEEGEGDRAMGDALDDVVRQLDQAFTSVGDSLRDPEAKEQLRRAVRSFGDALAATFSEVGGEIKTRIGSPPGGAAGTGPRPTSPG